MNRLDGRVAVVTGAAGGMGQGIAVRLASEGARLELLDTQDCSATLSLIRDQGATADAHLCDVTDEIGLMSTASRLAERHGRIDILVNNAAVLSGGKPWHEHSKQEFERFLEVNCVGYFLVTKAFHPLLRKSRAGRLINVASRTYFMANPGQLPYVASKGAVMGMTRVLARELGAEDITVNAVAPGMIATPGTLEFFPQDEAFDLVMQNQIIKKRGRPRHLADLVAFLASDEAELITGQFILCDGGGYLP